MTTTSSGSTWKGTFPDRSNFASYAESRYGSLLVTNMYGIVGGRDEEDDDSYRTRIHWKLISPNGVNETALRFDLLQVPGIQDVVFDRRAGTFTCYVYAITPVAAASILAMVQERLEKVFPLTGLAVNPDLVGITLATTLKLTAGASQTDRDIVTAQARQAAEDYLNNLKIGEPLIINEIADRIRNSHPRILDVGEPNRQIAGAISCTTRCPSNTRSAPRAQASADACLGRTIQ